MRYLSVCSGIEAATVAWHPLGWTPVGFSEIESFPRGVLEQRHGGVAVDWDHRWSPGQNYPPIFGDFTKIEAHHVGPVDLLVGGTPCQSFSVAGKRLGLDDPRGNLAIEFLALAKRIGARWVVWENVPGVYSSWSGEPDDEAIAEWVETADFVEFLNLFRECGYRGAWRTIDAQYVRVDGFGRAVPQRRRRVFLVGHLGNDARAIPVLFDPESLRGLATPRREAGQGTAVPSGDNLERHCGDRKLGSPSGVAHTLRADGFDASEDGTGRGTPIISVSVPVAPTISARTSGGGGLGLGTDAECDGAVFAVPAASAVHFQARGSNIDVDQHTAATLTGNCDRVSGGAPSIAFSIKDDGRDVPEDVSPCLRSMNSVDSNANAGGQVAVAYSIQERAVSENPNNGPQGKGWQANIAYTLEARHHVQFATVPSVNGWAVRKLTPRECERLQGFPDDFTAITVRGKPAADGPRYKAIGNSMAVNVMRWIGARIALVEKAIAAAAERDAA